MLCKKEKRKKWRAIEAFLKMHRGVQKEEQTGKAILKVMGQITIFFFKNRFHGREIHGFMYSPLFVFYLAYGNVQGFLVFVKFEF